MGSASELELEDDEKMQECSGCEDLEALEACLLRYFPAEDIEWRITEFCECCGCGKRLLPFESHNHRHGIHPEDLYCENCFFKAFEHEE